MLLRRPSDLWVEGLAAAGRWALTNWLEEALCWLTKTCAHANVDAIGLAT